MQRTRGQDILTEEPSPAFYAQLVASMESVGARGQREVTWQGSYLEVLGTAETPQIDQGVGHQFHRVVALLDVLEPQQQPLEFVLPRKRALHPIP